MNDTLFRCDKCRSAFAPLVAWPTHPRQGYACCPYCGDVVTKYVRESKNAPKLASPWATPAARDWKNGQASDETMGRNARPLNEQAVMLAGWDSPTVADGEKPTVADGEKLTERSKAGIPRQLPSGPPSTSSPVGTARRGVLNPAHSRWLMGYPASWDRCSPFWCEWELIQNALSNSSETPEAVWQRLAEIALADSGDTATPSSLKSLPSSSAPTAKQGGLT